MILAFLILDPSKFSLFEYFPDRSHMNDIFSIIDQFEELEGNFSHDGLNLHLSKFDGKLSYCLVYTNEELDPELPNRLSLIAKNVMKGDKLALRQLLQSKRMQDLMMIN